MKVKYALRILYHHRTRATDAQRVHILSMIRAFEQWGHEVVEVALVPARSTPHDPRREGQTPAWKRWTRPIPFAAEFLQAAYTPAGWIALTRAATGHPVDFIYERYAFANFAGVLWARRRGVPLILEVNSPLAQELQAEGHLRSRKLALWAERTICNLATCVVCVSRALRDILVAEGVRPERILVLPNGVDLNGLRQGVNSQLVQSLQERFQVQGRMVVGFVGWFRKWHGLEALLECFRQSPSLRERALLLLVGDGPVAGVLRQATSQWGLERCVQFAGPVPHELVPAHVALFDVAVQPAANTYCCPMKLVEYMALGKAILAPDQPNVRELVEDGSTALLFHRNSTTSLRQALEKLLDDAVLRRGLGVRARRSLLERGLLWTSNARIIQELVTGYRKNRNDRT